MKPPRTARASAAVFSRAQSMARCSSSLSSFRRVQGWPSAALSGLAPAAAWRQPVEAASAQAMASLSEMKAAAVAQPVRLVASARLPAEGAASALGAKEPPPGAAEVLPGPWGRRQEAAGALPGLSARQPAAGAAEVGSAAEAQPQEGAEAASGAEVQPREAALDAVAEPQQAGAGAALLDAEVPRPGVAEEPAPSARQPAAERPSAAPWVCRPVQPLPWLAPRQAVRSAHAMRRSRTGSPSRQTWRAAGCEGFS